jgi:hypothetical protein
MELDGSDKKATKFTDKAKADGYDGIEATSGYGISKLYWFVAFDKNQIKSATDNNGEFDSGNNDIRFSIRKGDAPKKTGIGYKVFALKDGKLYPPMVANPGGKDTPVGVWLNADAAPVVGTSKTGRLKVKAGGKGTQGGSGTLAYRPGWHLGEIPYALQFNRVNPGTGTRELFPNNFVWAEVEYANDVDYQDEAMSYGMNPSGKFQHSLAGLPKVPENGSYRYRTNPNPETDPWIITGAMRVNKILTPSEVDKIVRDAGREPQPRQEGSVTDEQVNALNEQMTRFRFIGERGAERLDKAEEATTRIDNLNVAREMEDSGKDAKAIKLATGWERGDDEKWRYEQPDYKRTSSQGDAHPERYSLSKEEYEEFERLDEEAMDASDKAKKIYKRRGEDSVYHSAAEEYVTGGMDEAKVKRYLSLSRKYDELDSTQRYLDDYIDDDDLFKAYPELKDVKLNIEYRDTNPLGGLMGSYNPETNTITLYHGFDTSTLAHEIQHSIQRIEGFAKGGNMKIVKAAKNNIRETKKTISRLFESDKDYKKWVDGLSEDELEKMEGDKYDDLEFSMYYRYLDTLEQNAETYNLREKLNNANDFIKRNLKEIGLNRSDWRRIIDKGSYEIYERFAGETESRNVQGREHMTPEERRASLAGETEDVAREDQIFLQEGMGTSEMGSKVPRRMREIKETLKDADLDDNQRAVVDAFTGDKDNTRLTVEREDGKHTVIMRQGSEGGAGTKHSLYRHYGTSVGVISADDLKLVPEILTKGECEENERGRVKLNVYRYIDNNGTVYTVLTERREGHEIFNDFYTNKKAPTSASSNTPEGARSIQVEASKPSYTNASSPEGNTPEGARRGNEDFDAAKVGQSSDSGKLNNPNRDADNGN